MTHPDIMIEMCLQMTPEERKTAHLQLSSVIHESKQQEKQLLDQIKKMYAERVLIRKQLFSLHEANRIFKEQNTPTEKHTC